MTKFITTMFALTTWTTLATGQNLIPNPSFELNDSCPNFYGEFDRVQNWHTVYQTPDYFNSCATNNNASVPDNIFGFQQASTGNAYVGIYVYSFPDNSCGIHYREYIGCPLNSPVSIGTRYYVTFKVSPTTSNSTSFMYAIDKIGMLFTTQFYFPEYPLIFKNYSQIYSNVIISDTDIWTTISGSFIADSNYNFISIGNFFTDSLNNTASIGGINNCSYYYVDDVCVSKDSLTCTLFTGINDNLVVDKVSVFPNPFTTQTVLQTDKPLKNATLTLYNALGQQVKQVNNISGKTVTIHRNNLPSGLYYLQLIQDNQTIATDKLVIE